MNGLATLVKNPKIQFPHFCGDHQTVGRSLLKNQKP
jgi:hypothetical protein